MKLNDINQSVDRQERHYKARVPGYTHSEMSREPRRAGSKTEEWTVAQENIVYPGNQWEVFRNWEWCTTWLWAQQGNTEWECPIHSINTEATGYFDGMILVRWLRECFIGENHEKLQTANIIMLCEIGRIFQERKKGLVKELVSGEGIHLPSKLSFIGEQTGCPFILD